MDEYDNYIGYHPISDLMGLHFILKGFLGGQSGKQQQNSVLLNDVNHLFRIYQETKEWFDQAKVDKEEFLAKLSLQLHDAWKRISPQTDFLNIYAGETPLSNSEHIKTLFILDTLKQNPDETGKSKVFDLRRDWEKIENQLQDDEFWSFICDNDYYDNLDTRIDLIIDLANQVTIVETEEQKGVSFNGYNDLFQRNERLDWKAIKHTFNKIKEWYTDKELYHYIGFLIVTKYEKLASILQLSKFKNKEDFKKLLLKVIQHHLSKTKDVDGKKIQYHRVENLNYEKDTTASKNILLLLHVEDYLKRDSNEKFPFSLYLKEKRSVAHINPRSIETTTRQIYDLKGMDMHKEYIKSQLEKYFYKVGEQ
ncbi:hypothetical protein ACFOUP_16890 [Belliella kenyensis]|uniref:DUF1524 domain-containing protein n=1 Tax=Belliella kenyensis TaxID=1472724 RepID=A0ABV8ERW8_9BACT|nr:hypothetical protein [Belliella kenyensis]MCH7402874.1 hypothetical protein [Belliella kenyensis]MDN3602580.1 hypothetical protein [Belliella kenyensis]